MLEDLRNMDPLAREIIERVDRGAYGTQGRRGSSPFVSTKVPFRAGSGSGDEKSPTSPGVARESQVTCSDQESRDAADNCCPRDPIQKSCETLRSRGLLRSHIRDHVSTAVLRGDTEHLVDELMEALKYRG